MKLFHRTAADPKPAASRSPADTLGGVNARTAAKQRMVLVGLLTVVTLGGVSYMCTAVTNQANGLSAVGR